MRQSIISILVCILLRSTVSVTTRSKDHLRYCRNHIGNFAFISRAAIIDYCDFGDTIHAKRSAPDKDVSSDDNLHDNRIRRKLLDLKIGLPRFNEIRKWIHKRKLEKFAKLGIMVIVARLGISFIQTLQNRLDTTGIYDKQIDENDHTYSTQGSLFNTELHSLLEEFNRLNHHLNITSNHEKYYQLLGFIRAVHEQADHRCEKLNRAVYISTLTASLQSYKKMRLNLVQTNDSLIHSNIEWIQTVNEISLLCLARLADAQLRVVRDAIIQNIIDIKKVLQYWKDRKRRDNHMGLLKSTALSIFLRKQGESNRGRKLLAKLHEKRIVSLDLYVKKYTFRLGRIQKLLSDMPSRLMDFEQNNPHFIGKGKDKIETWLQTVLSCINQFLDTDESLMNYNSSQKDQNDSSTAEHNQKKLRLDQVTNESVQQNFETNQMNQGPDSSDNCNYESNLRGEFVLDRNSVGRASSSLMTDKSDYQFDRNNSMNRICFIPVTMLQHSSKPMFRSFLYDAVYRPSDKNADMNGLDRFCPALSRLFDLSQVYFESIAISAIELTKIVAAFMCLLIISVQKDRNKSLFVPNFSSKKEKFGNLWVNVDEFEITLIKNTKYVVTYKAAQRQRVACLIDKVNATILFRIPISNYLCSAIVLEIFRRKGYLSTDTKGIILSTFRRAKDGLQMFFIEQLFTPATAIINSVVFRQKKRQDFSNEKALQDSKKSLQKLLNDFIKDTEPKVSEKERNRRATCMDISAVSQEFEKNIRNPVRTVINGRLLRTLLIQIQYFKIQGLAIMETIDDLYKANQLNLQLLASIPALLVLAMSYISIRSLFHSISSNKIEPTTLVHADIRSLLKDIDRALVLNNAPFLYLEEYGSVVMNVYLTRALIYRNSTRFDASIRRNFEQDLRDMLSSNVTVSQQLKVLRRMQRSYPFLQHGEISISGI